MRAGKSEARIRRTKLRRVRGEPGEPPQVGEPPEEGLSIDADKLGPSYLRRATEQDNFETVRGAPRELDLASEPPTDGPVERSGAAGSVWDDTVDEAAKGGQIEHDELELGERAADADPERVPGGRGRDQVDLTEDAIEEASLFDAEAEELGEVNQVDATTDDTSAKVSRKRRP